MIKRILSALIVLVLALGCVFALAEATTEASAATEETAAVEETTATEAVAATEETAAAEETATAEEAAAVEGKTRYIRARSGLNIRAAADLEAEIVATPDFNYAVKVIGEEGKWSHVLYESNDQVYEGYCWTAYLCSHKTVVKDDDEDEAEEDTDVPEEEKEEILG